MTVVAPTSHRAFLRSALFALCGACVVSLQECRAPSRNGPFDGEVGAAAPARQESHTRPVPDGSVPRPPGAGQAGLS